MQTQNRSERTNLMEPVTLAFEDYRVRAATRNISSTGLCVDTSAVLADGRLVGVSFNSGGDAELYRVVWSNAVGGRFRAGLAREDATAQAA